MNPNYDIVGACQLMREEAKNLARENYAFGLQRKTGMLDWLTSPENGGTNARLIRREGKLVKLEVFYDQRTKECQITDDCFVSVCDQGSTPVRKRFEFTMDNCIFTPVREYTLDDMIVLCKDTKTFMRERMESDMRAGREHLSLKMLGEVDALKGMNLLFGGGSIAAGGSKTVDLIANDTFGQSIPLPGNFAPVMLDYETNQLNGKPAFIGQGNFELFWKLHGWSCCNATTPYGTANLEGEGRFYVDQAANGVLGNNDILMVAPGAVKSVFFNENELVEKMGTNSPTTQSIVIDDFAGYPFKWNFDLYYDICDKKWKSVMSLQWGVFGTFQDDSFASNADTPGSPDCSDELDGMTGVFGLTIT
jgi:hypothetical protein